MNHKERPSSPEPLRLRGAPRVCFASRAQEGEHSFRSGSSDAYAEERIERSFSQLGPHLSPHFEIRSGFIALASEGGFVYTCVFYLTLEDR